MKTSFGSKLRKAREEAGYRVCELAKHLGVSTVYSCDIENGRRYPSRKRLPSIAEFLGVDVSELEVWEAIDRGRVIIDLSVDYPVGLAALELLRHKRCLGYDRVMAVVGLLKGG